MELAKGITGFKHYTDAELPITDERAFHKVCHSIARSLHGEIEYTEQVTEYREKNFSIVTIAIGDHKVSVVLNAHYPYLAFASPLSRDDNAISFVEWPAGASEFEQCSNYTILTTQELAIPFSQIAASSLGDAELEQIKYWRPQTVGELIYNFWD